MKILPSSETYEKEYVHFPWKSVVEKSIKFAVKNTPKNGKVLDLMCGTGYILSKIREQRPDLELVGIDNNKEFLKYAKKYSKIKFECKNVLQWEPKIKFDLIICTGGIHHIPYGKQKTVIKKIVKALKGKAFIADPFVRNYNTEEERKIAAAELGVEYVKATIKTKPDKDVLNASIDIMRNDVLGLEYKSSIKKMLPVYQKSFDKVKLIKTWPKRKSEYGDYILICE